MKITGVELSSDNSNVFSFGMVDIPSNDKYLIKTIVGLDADEVIHKYYGTGTSSDKPKFHNFSLQKREVVMRIVLNPNYSINETVSDLRDEMYRAISSSRTGLINLLFTSGGAAVATLSGFITKFEVPYFSKVSELQITIKCKDGLLRGYNPIELDPEDISSTNPVLVSDSLSTAPHGVTMRLQVAAGTPATFTIKDDELDPSWSFSVTPDTPFQLGDILCICSDLGDKQLFRIRSGVTTHMMDRIAPGSLWPLIFPGGNEFVIENIQLFDWVYITHYPAYWGL